MHFEHQHGSQLPLKPGSLRGETVVDSYLEPTKKQRTLELGRAKHHLTDGQPCPWPYWEVRQKQAQEESQAKRKGPGLTQGLQWKPSATSLPATFQTENKIPTEARENECPSPTISQGLLDSQPQSLSTRRGASWRHPLRNPITGLNTMHAQVQGAVPDSSENYLLGKIFHLAFPRLPVTHWAE